MKKWILAVCAVLVLALIAAGTCALLWKKNAPSLQLRVLGDVEMTLEYGESFIDPGAEGLFQGQVFCKDGLQVPVKVTGTVDTKKTGSYTVEYSATVYTNYFSIHQEHTVTATRTVHVVDTQAPVITLFSRDGHFTLPGHPYEEEGFAATDNYDGDLTDLVQCSQSGGVLTYSVTDSSGNTATAERFIYYNDPEPPVLTLLGDNIILHPQGEEFVDPGYTVEDNCDTDLVCAIAGMPDVDTPGIYNLTYTVTDTFGNQATAQRRVVVRAKTVWPAYKTIYLTFDDGPSSHTPRLLDVLKKYNVKATFFVVDNSNLYLVERMVAEGHKIALHTASHNYSMLYSSVDDYFADLNQIRDAVAKYTDQPLTLIRFPGGSSNTVSRRYCKGIMTELARRVAEEGYYYFDWNLDSHDASNATTTEAVYQRVVEGLAQREFAMVLMHDIKGYSVDAVEAIIVWALANGYSFRTIDESTPGFHAMIQN